MKGVTRVIAGLESWWTRAQLRRCLDVGEGTRVFGRVWVHGGGAVRVGRGVTFDGRSVPIELHSEPGAEIVIGDGAHLGPGVSLEAQHAIVVGPRCRLEALVKVLDNHFHPVRGNRHERPASTRVVLEEGVRVGSKAILLPGAYVQRGATVGAGAVISRKVPAGARVEGSPARPVAEAPREA